MKKYKRCARCIMDNVSDDTIEFDDEGNCNYCTDALKRINTTIYFPNETGNRKLNELLDEIRVSGKGHKYDAIMGISGGLDSSYLAYLGSKWGLRILLIHVDDGFDTEISKHNLEKLVKATGFNYIVIKPDAEQYNDLTKAFLKAGVPNIAVPQDNILFANLYRYMRENKIKYFISGGNFALECILQRGNTHDAFDVSNIKDIHRRFGTKPINKLEIVSSFRLVLERRLMGVKSPRPLDFMDYNREKAFKELADFCGFEYYGSKHLENTLTAFAQLYWFPKKFNVDKRKSHLSSMIISGQMTREEALAIMEKPMVDPDKMEKIIAEVKEKLQISDEEFEEIMNAETHQHTDYKTDAETFAGKCFTLYRKMRYKAR